MKKYIALLGAVGAAEIGLALYLTFWRESFWQAVSAHQYSEFINMLYWFTGAALLICFVSGMSGYLLTISAIKWREKLNTKALALKLGNEVLNTPQRIQEDCYSYPDLVLQLGFGWAKAVVYIIAFSISLLISFSWSYLIILVVYGAVATLISGWVAKPLIKMNYATQQAEASYRAELTPSNFDHCIKVLFGMARKQKRLSYTQAFLSQVGVVVPFIIIAPVYFTTAMPIGLLMRFNSTASTVLDNLSYGMSSFGMLNKLLACRKRLKEIDVI